MKRIWPFLYKIFSILASLELAVFVILALAIFLAVGTVYESKYGMEAAGFYIYRSWWMTLGLFLLFINVLSSALSRLPWKRQHIGFLITHLGILTLIVGSMVTRQLGIDGLMALAPNESSRFVRLEEKMINVFRTEPNTAYDLVLSQPIQLFEELKSPIRWSLHSPSKIFTILQYLPKALRDVNARAVESDGIPAVKFKIQGSRATIVQWIFLHRKEGVSADLGPAEIHFNEKMPVVERAVEKNTLFLYLDAKKKLHIATVRKGQKTLQNLGEAKKNHPVILGWMDFQFLLEEFFPKAEPQVQYHKVGERGLAMLPADSSPVEALEVEFLGERRWMELGSSLQLTKDTSIYYVQFTPKQVDVGFETTLKDFRVKYYEGTQQPKSYESTVFVAGSEHLISMNEPMDKNGFTFYQSSYTTDDEGKPLASVLSVNKDPGRKIKYLGSLMIVLGIISMFYFKPIYSGNNKFLFRLKKSTS